MAGDSFIAPATIYSEASSASQMERECVAHSIRNRVVLGRWGHSPSEVCVEYAQYSSWNGDRVSRSNLMRVMRAPDNDPVYLECVAAWEASETSPDPTDGATHYHDKTEAAPYWAGGARMTLETAKFFFYSGVR